MKLSIDGGQTGSRIRLSFDDGHVEERDGAGIDTSMSVVDQIADIATRSVLDMGIDTNAESVSVLAAGVSGLTPAGSRPERLRALTAGLGVTDVALAHDSVTGYLAANGLALGAVTAVGTGVVTLGVGERVARVDGWGYLLGDAGSAYWIGRMGLDAALRAFDGRGQATELGERAVISFGPFEEIYMRLQAREDRVPTIARFAREVADAALRGDVVAAEILAAAADELATSVVSALRRCRAESSARVSWVGAVMGNDVLRSEFTDAVSRSMPGVTVAPPRGRTLDGVEALNDVPADHPLAEQISRSSPD
ncbi:BadF/BadG/BcrA/BcrD ATPase family protein [Gordonia jinhuaensis]|uniref:ATPase BadF/BadG/BcrA/BcrD type domain-containing protein n=1 Tax=Gordonia jinhuaensis TaxID=1517702 RepID=A0A916T0D3_9ACTN|nr:BadF/BadG/BcrA/BcrD ATPase family protein [Gordonia jinhuaensis]GGB22770.1 hypothetical protein GCM10011489_08760 [Gordonia jinhuaensis]